MTARRCPLCAIPEVPVDEDGKIVRHTRWTLTEHGPQKLRSYCRAQRSEPVDA